MGNMWIRRGVLLPPQGYQRDAKYFICTWDWTCGKQVEAYGGVCEEHKHLARN